MTKKIEVPKKRTLVSVVHVNKGFGAGSNSAQVLHDVSASIFQNEFTMIYGPSGSGKSTLLNTILGLENVDEGIVSIKGVDITKMSDDARARFRNQNVGVVYQQPYWVKTLNVIDNVSLPLAISRMDAKKANTIALEKLSHVGMESFAKKSPMTLSGGQQQKVSIARSLVCDPLMIVADEPTGNLDSISANDIIQLFLWLIQNFRKSVIMVTHEMNFLRYADRAISIHDGRIESILNKKELIEVIGNMQNIAV